MRMALFCLLGPVALATRQWERYARAVAIAKLSEYRRWCALCRRVLARWRLACLLARLPAPEC